MDGCYTDTPLHPDPQQLLQAFVDFVQATSWPQSKRILEQHLELLGDEVDAILSQLAAAQESKGAHDLVEAHRALLQRCRSMGVEAAFAEIERASQPAIPVEFQEDLHQAKEAEQRYENTGERGALNAAVSAWERLLTHALFSQTPGAFQRAVFNDAGGAYLRRYWDRGELADLDRSLILSQQALSATAPDATDRAMYLSNLGNGLHDRYARSGQPADLEAAHSAYRGACELGLETALEPALVGARSWGNWALERRAWEEAAEAYDYGAKAVERLLEAQLRRSAKESWLREVQGLAANAAYALARLGDLQRAVEVIEGGRARLLAEALERHRQDLEQLPARGQAELLARYQQAAERWAALTAEPERPSDAPRPDAATRRDALAAARAELDAVVEVVRQVPDYADFLRAPTFAQIQDAAREAPLVYLIATPAGGLALIVSPMAEGAADSRSSGAQTVWLDALTDAAVRERLQGPEDSEELGGYLGAYARRNAEPFLDNRTHWYDTVEATTRWLWEALMGPLMEVLTPAVVTQASPVPELVLIPTGRLGLLPLHAAWTECAAALRGRRYVVDVVAPRYAPNARALSFAHALAAAPRSERLLLCVEPEPVSDGRLLFAEHEALDILRYWPTGCTDRWHKAATHDELVRQLPRHTCLHFVGHALAGWEEPQQGGLLLASNRVLTVRELAGMRLTLRLAILSACETGVPGTRLPDEVIGLPTALMEAGVAGVVASFWSVADDSPVRLMAHFHRLWRLEGFAPPEALRRAQIELRDQGYAHPFYWGAFGYTGL
jgi:hypothetical protein